MVFAMMQSSTLGSTDAKQLRQLLENQYQGSSLKTFKRGQTIPLLPQDVWVVYRGVVQLVTLYPSGDEAVLGFAVPLMPFGMPLTITQPYQAIALTDVDLMRLQITDIEQSPALTQCLLQQMHRRLQQTEALLALASYRRVEERLLHLLDLLTQELGQPSEDGNIRLSARLTHQHLANTIGTTRVTITRLLGQLRDRGYLTLDEHRHLVIRNRLIQQAMGESFSA